MIFAFLKMKVSHFIVVGVKFVVLDWSRDKLKRDKIIRERKKEEEREIEGKREGKRH